MAPRLGPQPLVSAPGTSRLATAKRRQVSSREPSRLGVRPLAPASSKLKGKGGKWASLVPGPFVSALETMPPRPLNGAQLVAAGRADETVPHEASSDALKRRAACALVAIMPWECAPFVLEDDDADVRARPVPATIRSLVTALAVFSESQLSGATTALGSLLVWAAENKPEEHSLCGSVVLEYLQQPSLPANVDTNHTWLRDHLGIKLPVRGTVYKGVRNLPPKRTNDKESFTLRVMLGFEHLARHHPSRIVRGHAAGWFALGMLSMRLEQSSSFVINSLYSYEYSGSGFVMVLGAVRRDKHPDHTKRRPRPAWGVIDGVVDPGAVRDALTDMLEGAEDACCVLLDTDSKSGDPSDATRFVRVPLEQPRADASLQALLRMAPISMPAEEAARYHGHSAKRFLLNVTDSSDAFSPSERAEFGRFAGSTAQHNDLSPAASALVRHDLRSTALPDVYSDRSKISTVFDVLCRAQLLLRAVAATCASSELPLHGGWGKAGPFARLCARRNFERAEASPPRICETPSASARLLVQ